MNDTKMNTQYSQPADTGSGPATSSEPMSSLDSGSNSEQILKAKKGKASINTLMRLSIGVAAALVLMGGAYFYLTSGSQSVPVQPIEQPQIQPPVSPPVTEPSLATPSVDPSLTSDPTSIQSNPLSADPSLPALSDSQDPNAQTSPMPTLESNDNLVGKVQTNLDLEDAQNSTSSDMVSRLENLEKKYLNLDGRVSRLESMIGQEVGRLKSVLSSAGKKAKSSGRSIRQKTVVKNEAVIKVPQVLTNDVMKPTEVVMAPQPVLPPPPVEKKEVAVIAQPEEPNQIIIYGNKNNTSGHHMTGPARQVLKGSSEPEQTSLSSMASRQRINNNIAVQAVIPGRAWIRNEDGIGISYVVGDVLDDNRTVVSIDPDAGTVALSDGTVLN